MRRVVKRRRGGLKIPVAVNVLLLKQKRAILSFFASIWIRPQGRFGADYHSPGGLCRLRRVASSIRVIVVLQLSPAVHAQTAGWLTGPRLTDGAMVAFSD